jgi:hypothetical protein
MEQNNFSREILEAFAVPFPAYTDGKAGGGVEGNQESLGFTSFSDNEGFFGARHILSLWQRKMRAR